jgi:hypothetical protein
MKRTFRLQVSEHTDETSKHTTSRDDKAVRQRGARPRLLSGSLASSAEAAKGRRPWGLGGGLIAALNATTTGARLRRSRRRGALHSRVIRLSGKVRIIRCLGREAAVICLSRETAIICLGRNAEVVLGSQAAGAARAAGAT